ncbi:MAG: hypothetical protein AAGF28_02525 [Pseudomonadota bacterium]
MPVARPFCSKTMRSSKTAALNAAFVASALLLTGCNATGGGSLFAGLSEGLSSRKEAGKTTEVASTAKPSNLNASADVKTNIAKPDRTVVGSVDPKKSPAPAKAPAEKPKLAASQYQSPSFKSSYAAPKLPPLPAKCRHLIAEAGAEAILLRSPTVSAQADHEGQFGASVGYDVIDLRRAQLKEELALANCRRYTAARNLQQLLVTSPQALTRAGYIAQASSLRGSRGEFASIRKRIKGALSTGLMTTTKATLLQQYLDQIAANEPRLRAEAARREAVDAIQLRDVVNLDQQLVDAERDVGELQRRLRNADTFKIKLTGGYNSSKDNQLQSQSIQDDIYGKVKISLRLGALSPRRAAFEDEMMASRVDTLFEHQSGVFWKASEIARANRSALNALKDQRAQVNSAYAAAMKNKKTYSAAYEPELLSSQLRARIDVANLGALRAGLDATIADVERLDKKLSFRR